MYFCVDLTCVWRTYSKLRTLYSDRLVNVGPIQHIDCVRLMTVQRQTCMPIRHRIMPDLHRLRIVDLDRHLWYERGTSEPGQLILRQQRERVDYLIDTLIIKPHI